MMGSTSDTSQSKFLILLVLSSFNNIFLIFRNGDRAFYRCKQSDCSIRVTLDTTNNIITDNELLVKKIQVKVEEAKKKALKGAYTKFKRPSLSTHTYDSLYSCPFYKTI